MNHPELLAVPALMLADYFLTILGAKQSATVYRNHFTTPSYELNPLWRKSVDQLRWFNPRHLVLVAVVTVMLVLFDQLNQEDPEALPDEIVQFVLAMLFGAFGSVCGRHLANLLLFRYLNRHPQEISGQVQLSIKLMLKMSQFQYLGWIPLFILIAVLAPNPYTIGVPSGILAIVLAHTFWARKARSPEAQHASE